MKDVAIEVLGEHGNHAGEQRRAKISGLFAQRIFERNGWGVGRERGAFGRAGEGAGEGFGVAEFEQAGADGLLGAYRGVWDDFGRGGQRVGESIVAVDAGDLFDEVDLAGEIKTPGGELGVILVGSDRSQRAAEGGEVLKDERAGDSFGGDGRTEVALDLMDRELDGGAARGGGFEARDDDVDEFAFEVSTAGGKNGLAHKGVGNRCGSEVGAPLEAVAGVGVEQMPTRAGADGGRIEPGGFDDDVFCLGGDHGIPSAHDAGEAECFDVVGDNEVFADQGAGGAVKQLDLLPCPGAANGDAASDLVEVEGVRRVAHTEEDKVGGVDCVRDGLLTEGLKIVSNEAGCWGDFDAADDAGREAAAEVRGFNCDGQRFDGWDARGQRDVERGEGNVVDRGRFPGDAVVVHGVDAIGGDVHVED